MTCRGVHASECARAQRTRGRAQHTRAGALTLALSLPGKEARCARAVGCKHACTRGPTSHRVRAGSSQRFLARSSGSMSQCPPRRRLAGRAAPAWSAKGAARPCLRGGRTRVRVRSVHAKTGEDVLAAHGHALLRGRGAARPGAPHLPSPAPRAPPLHRRAATRRPRSSPPAAPPVAIRSRAAAGPSGLSARRTSLRWSPRRRSRRRRCPRASCPSSRPVNSAASMAIRPRARS